MIRTTLKALGFIAQVLATIVFGVILYAISPLLFFIWLGLGGAALLFYAIVWAVRLGVRLETKSS